MDEERTIAIIIRRAERIFAENDVLTLNEKAEEVLGDLLAVGLEMDLEHIKTILEEGDSKF